MIKCVVIEIFMKMIFSCLNSSPKSMVLPSTWILKIFLQTWEYFQKYLITFKFNMKMFKYFIIKNYNLIKLFIVGVKTRKFNSICFALSTNCSTDVVCFALAPGRLKINLIINCFIRVWSRNYCSNDFLISQKYYVLK